MKTLARCPFLPAALALLMLVVGGRAQARLVVTLERPGVQQSRVPAVTVETFDGPDRPPGHLNFLATPIGDYSTQSVVRTFAVVKPDEYGGSHFTQYASVGTQSGYTEMTLRLKERVAYFGFEWLAGDGRNLITFYDGARAVGSFSTSHLVAFIDTQQDRAGYYGHPEDHSKDPIETFAYVNVFVIGGKFDRVVFSNSKSTGTGFETDNHSVARELPEVLPGRKVPTVGVGSAPRPGPRDARNPKAGRPPFTSPARPRAGAASRSAPAPGTARPFAS